MTSNVVVGKFGEKKPPNFFKTIEEEFDRLLDAYCPCGESAGPILRDMFYDAVGVIGPVFDYIPDEKPWIEELYQLSAKTLPKILGRCRDHVAMSLIGSMEFWGGDTEEDTRFVVHLATGINLVFKVAKCTEPNDLDKKLTAMRFMYRNQPYATVGVVHKYIPSEQEVNTLPDNWLVAELPVLRDLVDGFADVASQSTGGYGNNLHENSTVLALTTSFISDTKYHMTITLCIDTHLYPITL